MHRGAFVAHPGPASPATGSNMPMHPGSESEDDNLRPYLQAMTTLAVIDMIAAAMRDNATIKHTSICKPGFRRVDRY